MKLEHALSQVTASEPPARERVVEKAPEVVICTALRLRAILNNLPDASTR
jgi:hypothetical protein